MPCINGICWTVRKIETSVVKAMVKPEFQKQIAKIIFPEQAICFYLQNE